MRICAQKSSTVKSRESKLRLKISIRGVVQGVGFRPFVYRLATDLGLKGWVNNSAQGVFIEVEGDRDSLVDFLRYIDTDKPQNSSISSLDHTFLNIHGYSEFEIKHSDTGGSKTALVLPDIATCSHCVEEIFDPTNRRYLYPFTNCTACGPRYSIIEALPYDRPNTSMKMFRMCKECQEEYENPQDRRFHAQPNACPKCGPHLELWDAAGKCLAIHHDAMLKTVEAIRNGLVIAVKGLGGFHLVVDAWNQDAVQTLRKRKRREEKPFALMYPNLDKARKHCQISSLEERLLESPEHPIVLLHSKDSEHTEIASSVAPGNPYLGVMLPYTPLHHILMRELNIPIVATSANLKEEPICTDENEALIRLQGIADLFLVHNRPIVRHVDDSVVRIMSDREMMLRRARGYAPLPVNYANPDGNILAVGAHQKNSIALAVRKDVFLSQHIGDLETAQSLEAFKNTIDSLCGLYEATPQVIACDQHPDYISTDYAHQTERPTAQVQHHYAHIMSCMVDNNITGTALGVSWDGTGYGLDGTIWGGEFLRITQSSFDRFAHIRQFRLPGGEIAAKEPRRSALGLLFAIHGDRLREIRELESLTSFSDLELRNLLKILASGLHAPATSSAGRLFDAVSSIVGVRQINAFEGQAAMELEFAADGVQTDDRYNIDINNHNRPYILNWEPMIRHIIDDLNDEVSIGTISAKFHNALSESIVSIAQLASEENVILSGGCFQNKIITERTVLRLREEGFQPYWHRRVPPNDGGIALGQIVAAGISNNKDEK